MSFAVRLLRIADVIDHPNADRLSIYQVRGYSCIAAKDANGQHRFAVGERVVYVPEGALLTEDQLKEHGFWGYNAAIGKEAGTLFGTGYNRVKTVRLRKRDSTGLIWKEPAEFAHLPDNTDVAARLGITKFEPEVPEAMLKVARIVEDVYHSYDIARLRMYPNLLVGNEIVITEKLEGESLQLNWLGGKQFDGLHHGGRIGLTTKGLAQKRMAIVDCPETSKIAVVRAAFASDLIVKLAGLAEAVGADRKILLVAEAIGPGVKKLHYAGQAPYARVIDISIDGRWLDEDEKAALFAAHSMERAPLLYRGPFDPQIIESLREGPTTIGGQHIREGIVITAVGPQVPRATELGDEIRPILKAHSDVFVRKFDHSEDS